MDQELEELLQEVEAGRDTLHVREGELSTAQARYDKAHRRLERNRDLVKDVVYGRRIESISSDEQFVLAVKGHRDPQLLDTLRNLRLRIEPGTHLAVHSYMPGNESDGGIRPDDWYFWISNGVTQYEFPPQSTAGRVMPVMNIGGRGELFECTDEGKFRPVYMSHEPLGIPAWEFFGDADLENFDFADSEGYGVRFRIGRDAIQYAKDQGFESVFLEDFCTYTSR